MPMELLRHIADQRLPLAIDVPSDIDKLRVLRAAELVTALIAAAPPPSTADPNGRHVAQVLTITPKGREALRSGLDPAIAQAWAYRDRRLQGDQD